MKLSQYNLGQVVMYTLTEYISKVVNALPPVELPQDISALSSNIKKDILRELVERTGQVDGWFIWSVDLYKYSVEANLIEKVVFEDTTGLDVGTALPVLNKPIIYIKSYSTDSGYVGLKTPTTSDNTDVSLNSVVWEISNSSSFSGSVDVVNDSNIHNLITIITNLEENKLYYMRAKYISTDSDVSDYSDTISITTLPPLPPLQPFVSVNNVDDQEWDISSVLADGYTIEKIKEVVLKKLKPNTDYTIKTRVHYPGGNYSQYSQPRTIRIVPAIQTPKILLTAINKGCIYVAYSRPIIREDSAEVVDKIVVRYGMDATFSVGSATVESTDLTNEVYLPDVSIRDNTYIQAKYVSASGYETTWSDTVSINTIVNNDVAPPYIIDHSSSGGNVTINLSSIKYDNYHIRTVSKVRWDFTSSDNNFTVLKESSPFDSISLPIGVGAEDIHSGISYSCIATYILDDYTETIQSLNYGFKVV